MLFGATKGPHLFKGFRPVCLALLLSADVLSAATYYISPTGSDTNNGSLVEPWFSLRKAVKSTTAGDVVYLGPGTYNETVNLSRSGNSSNNITFIGSNAVIAGNVTLSGDYVLLSSITCSPPNGYEYNAISVQGQHDVLTNCTVVNYGAAASNQVTAIGIQGAYNLVVNCTIRDLNDIDAFHVFGHDQTIMGCTVTNVNVVNYSQNHTDFIQTWGAGGLTSYNVLVKNCVVINCACDIGNTETDGSTGTHDWTFENDEFINVANPFFSGLPNTRFYNCVFYRCAGSPLDTPITFYTVPNTNFTNSVVMDYDSTGSEVVNCAFLECGSNPTKPWEGGIGASGTDLDTLRIAQNYFGGTGYAAKQEAYIGSDAVNGGDPKFVGPDQCDFRPNTGSVLIGSGTNLFPKLTTDLNGYPWPTNGSWDIGAYAYRGYIVPRDVPIFNAMTRSETNLVVSGTNGPIKGNYYVLASTNPALPLTNWMYLFTNPFYPDGSFSFTNSINPDVPMFFYVLQVQGIPVINAIFQLGSNLVIRGTNGTPGKNYFILTSTNLETPATNWTLLSTNLFDLKGNFTFTNRVGRDVPRLFFRLQLP